MVEPRTRLNYREVALLGAIFDVEKTKRGSVIRRLPERAFYLWRKPGEQPERGSGTGIPSPTPDNPTTWLRPRMADAGTSGPPTREASARVEVVRTAPGKGPWSFGSNDSSGTGARPCTWRLRPSRAGATGTSDSACDPTSVGKNAEPGTAARQAGPALAGPAGRDGSWRRATLASASETADATRNGRRRSARLCRPDAGRRIDTGSGIQPSQRARLVNRSPSAPAAQRQAASQRAGRVIATSSAFLGSRGSPRDDGK